VPPTSEICPFGPVLGLFVRTATHAVPACSGGRYRDALRDLAHRVALEMDRHQNLAGRDLVPGGDYAFVQGEVRTLLQRFGCPRAAGSHRPRYLVDEEMAQRAADALRKPLR
jgi:hypothetical protein